MATGRSGCTGSTPGTEEEGLVSSMMMIWRPEATDGVNDGDVEGDCTAVVPVRRRGHADAKEEELLPLSPQLKGMGTRSASGEGMW